MKKIAYTILFLIACAAPAFAADELVTEVVCRNSRPIADAGIRLEIQSGGIAGLTQAKISEITIAGSREIASVLVKKTGSGIIRNYVGTDFELSILLERRDPRSAAAHAKLTAELEGRRVVEAMECELVPPHEPVFICMAYWSGWVYDLNSGECVQQNASGCSNPFTHKTKLSCERSMLTERQ